MKTRKGKLKKFTFSHKYFFKMIKFYYFKLLNKLNKLCIYSLASYKNKILNIILNIFSLEGHYEY